MKSSDYAIAPGELRTLVRIEEQTTTQDDEGQPLDNWPAVLTAYASVREATMGEVVQKNQLTSQVSHIVKLRWFAVAIRAGMRIVDVLSGQIYIIQAPANVDRRNRVLKLKVLELNGTE